MADAVTVKNIFDGGEHIIVQLTCISDGTGETAVSKISRSALLNSNKQIPNQLMFEWAFWSISGFSSVRLLWDHTVDDICQIFATGQGYMPADPPRVDPLSAGGTGDILLTSVGAIANATYDITMSFKKSGP